MVWERTFSVPPPTLTVTQLDGKLFACEEPKIPLPYLQNFSFDSNPVKALIRCVSKVNYPLHLGHNPVQCGSTDTPENISQIVRFEMWCWRRMEISWIDHVENKILVESRKNWTPDRQYKERKLTGLFRFA
jgi:hypothetical protein